jgi:short-subunit dehydrogenase
LGLALARKFGEQGSRLMLCARTAEELTASRQELSARGYEVHTATCDVLDQQEVQRLIDDAIARYGRIDILVNNAGVIKVGAIQTMTIPDFEQAMGIMFWGMVYTTLAVLPHMHERRQGRIVNITSIGAKVSVPHLVPYSCAKSAAAAFSEGIGAELHGTGVKVVTIAPGLMRTGSYLNAVFNGAEEGEAAWFSVSSSLPGLTIAASRAADQIVAATRKGTAEVILGTPASLLARIQGLFPSVTSNVLGIVNRLLLPAHGNGTKTGAETAALRRPLMKTLTSRGRAAAQDLQPAARQTL